MCLFPETGGNGFVFFLFGVCILKEKSVFDYMRNFLFVDTRISSCFTGYVASRGGLLRVF